jgi:tRNA A22 N-methylase
MTYNILVDEIKKLPLDEKEDLKNLLDKYLIEEKRNKIYKKYKKSLSEVKEGKLKYSNNIDTLKKELK